MVFSDKIRLSIMKGIFYDIIYFYCDDDDDGHRCFYLQKRARIPHVRRRGYIIAQRDVL